MGTNFSISNNEFYASKTLNTPVQSEIIPFYQPVFNVQNNQCSGFEILARKIDHAGNILLPVDFLKEFNTSTLLQNLTLTLFNKVSNGLLQISNKLKDKFYVAFNISASLLCSETFIDASIRMAEVCKYFNSELILEITEHEPLDYEIHRMSLLKLKKNDINILLDDFGTGYSGLISLMADEISGIKVPREIISQVQNNYKCEIILETTIKLARKLGLTLTVEGIEDSFLLKEAKVRGFDYMQGYYLCPPVSIEQYLDKQFI